MSNGPAHAAGASSTSLRTNTADSPAPAASPRAASIAAGEKSMPVTAAPSLAQDSVSSPIWHCRWASRNPTGDRSGRWGAMRARSSRTTGVIRPGSLTKSSTPYATRWVGTRSSQFARLAVIASLSVIRRCYAFSPHLAA